MRWFTVTIASLILSAGISQAQTLTGNYVNADIGTYSAGIVCSPTLLGRVSAPDTIAGHTNEIGGEVQFSTASRQVPAIMGMSFGVSASARAEDFPFVTMTIEHPPMGDNGITHQSWLMEIDQDSERVTLFSFEHDYELVEGQWSFTARNGEEVLYRADFEVVAPADLPVLTEMCGTAAFLS